MLWLKDLLIRDVETTKQKDEPNRFDFLDGYRGSLALIVALAHAKGSIDCLFLEGLANLSQRYCISGFFLLSSFLLTYKLIKDLQKSEISSIPILQYFTRRFFRVYLVFALFAWTAIYGSEFVAGYTYGKYTDFSQVLLLGYPGPNHLWTIAPEIKFYFLIPIICLLFTVSSSVKQFGPVVVFGVCVSWTIYDQLFNFFHLTPDDLFSYSKHTYLLKNHFSVFLVGSELAMGFYLSEQSEVCLAFAKKERIQQGMNYLSLVIAGFALIYYNDSINKSFDYR